MGILRLALGEGTTMKLFVLLASSPWLWLMPSPRLMPTPTTATTAWATTVLATDLDTGATDTDTVLATTTDTTARGPLTPSPPPLLRPRLMLIPTTAWATMVLDTVPTDTVLDTTDTPVLATTDTVLDTTARGPLRPSPPLPLMLMLRLIPTTATTAMDTDTVLDTTVLDTAPTDKGPADSRQLRNYIKFK